jgi:type 1 glutamine amidotransferase
MKRPKLFIGAMTLALTAGAAVWTSGALAQQAPPPAPAADAPSTRAFIDPLPPKKHVLVLGFAGGWHHGSITNGEATMWALGRESGLFDVEIRTDTKWLTKGNTGGGEARNLQWFDAIIAVNTTGVWDMTDEQKKDFISFIKDDGKGFVGVHAALDANHNKVWPEYTEMIGGEFAAHPWVTFAAPVIIEDRNFPATRHFSSSRLTIYDEIYTPREDNWSRDKMNVLMRLDENKLPAEVGTQEPYKSQSPVSSQAAGVPLGTLMPPAAGRGGPRPGGAPRTPPLRADKDYALAWAKMYGKGRVFYSTYGHTRAAFEDPDIRKMYLEAIKWVLGLTEASTASHPKVNPTL